MHFRTENDFLGDREIPNDVYYGVQTLRGIENFKITGQLVSQEPSLVEALALVKKAAALANRDLGVLEAKVANAIVFACDRIIAGEFLDQFPTDLIQGGAGTSTNMNANEVIANIALEHLGYQKGEYHHVNPNDHVNCSQSTNDAYPTALRIALHNRLVSYAKAMAALRDAFQQKGKEFSKVLKMGRTHLQDAVPMSLGDEFNGFATALGEELERLEKAKLLLLGVNMGATAIGTSVNAPRSYPELVVKYLKEVTGLNLVLAPDLVEATSDTGDYVTLSSVIKRAAVKLTKICNDLRLLASGPRTGFGEINLPQLQPGSSIMPGKVNPVIPEVVNQSAFYAIGCDLTVTLAASAGQLQLNVMEPVIAQCLFESIELLSNGCKTLRDKCIDGITANEEECLNDVLRSIGIITYLNPIIGHHEGDVVGKICAETGRSVKDVVVERGLMSADEVDQILSIESLKKPRYTPTRF